MSEKFDWPIYLLNNPYLTKEKELSIIKHFSEKA